MNNITREMIPTKNLAIGFYILFIGRFVIHTTKDLVKGETQALFDVKTCVSKKGSN